ncbi:MAG: iron chelate uptake ABC transporter family permease subunit [Methanomicrobiaceae archaeon]|nr:iron chelate uptake ABC transporter family permease subunit [Methanomicrobiaceae archaeon]
MITRRHWIVLAFLAGLLFLSIFATVTMGSTRVALDTILSDPTATLIIFELRLPRVIAAVLVGFGLAVAGTAMQGLFKNPMADPYILGTSSGGALAAVFSLVFLGGHGQTLLAFIGATMATFLVYTVARQRGRAPVETLLLSGIAVSLLLSAILTLIMWTAGENVHRIFAWLWGGFPLASWGDVGVASLILVGCAIIFVYARDLNVLALGEEEATHLGVNVERFKQMLLCVSSFITALAVSISGIIGFIGLITPHVMRLIVGPDHRILIPASMIAGGLILLWSDTMVRTFTSEMPVGVLTAFLGAPFFVYLLRTRMKA